MPTFAELFNPISQAEAKRRRDAHWFETDQAEADEYRRRCSGHDPVAIHNRQIASAAQRNVDWAEVVANLDNEEKVNDLMSGVNFQAGRDKTVVEQVAEYMAAAGGIGVTSRAVADRIGRSKRACDAALQILESEGQVFLRLERTRGTGSKRKVWVSHTTSLTIQLTPLAFGDGENEEDSLLDAFATTDTYFAGTDDEHESPA